MIALVIRLINNLSLRYKFFISYFLLVLFSFTIFIFVNTVWSSKDLEEQVRFTIRNIFGQTISFLEYKIENIENSLDIISVSDTLLKVLNNDSCNYTYEIGNWVLDKSKLEKLTFNLYSNKDVENVRLYMKSSFSSYSETPDYINLNKYSDSNWFKELQSVTNRFKFLRKGELPESEGNNCIPLVRIIPEEQNMKEIKAFIAVDIPEKNLISLIDKAAFTKGSSVLLIDREGNPVLSSTNSSFKDTQSLAELNASIGIKFQKGISLSKVKLGGVEYLLSVEDVLGSDWIILLLVPYADILNIIFKSRVQIILIIIGIIPFTLIIAFMAATSLTKKFKKLIVHMKHVESGNFDIAILPSGNDEIGNLTRNFNSMVTRIALLLNEKYQLGQEKKNAELKALQAQINPHFLYNTLDLIYWSAREINSEEICRLVSCLSQFYKLSLSRGEEIVTIKDELEHVKVYVLIQNMRFNNSITLKINVPEDLYAYKIPKIILQPIVENSILHGILEKKDESGNIMISGYSDNNIITIEIRDDGVGMSYEQMKSILTGSSPNNLHGYGIKNINDRLILFFQCQGCGLSFKSTQGSGTVALIRFPPVI